MKKVAKSILSILEELKLSSKGEEMCAIMKFYIEENHVPDKYKNVLSDEVAQQLSNFRGDIVWSLQMSTKWEKKRNLPWFQIFFANPDRKILWNHDSMKAFLDWAFPLSNDDTTRILKMSFLHPSIRNYRWNEENTKLLVDRLINMWNAGEELFRLFSQFTISCDVDKIVSFQRMAKRTSPRDSSNNYSKRSLDSHCTPGLASFRG